MKTTVVLLVILITNIWLAGEAVLKGRITLQESGAAVENAQVTAISANPTASNSSGIFELHFPNKMPGDAVNLQVEKTGLVVVNKKELERVILRMRADEEPLLIAMCTPGKWAENVAKFYDIAAESIMAAYQKDLKNIQQGLIAEKDREIKKLLAERDAALAQAKNIVEDFVGIKLDLCTTMLTIVFLNNSAPDKVQSAGVDIPALINRAIVILNKYPDIPQAQELLKYIESLK